MDYWQSFELLPKTLRQFVDNLETLKMILEDKARCNLFFNRFPYEQLFNFTVMDGCNVMLCIKILDLFSTYEEFCNYDDRFNYALEFILINLSHINNDAKEILPLLQLLLKILCRNERAMDNSFKYIFDRERILEVMLKMTKFKSVQNSKFVFYSSLLTRVIESNFPDSLNYMVCDFFEKFKEHNAFKEQIVICKLILNSETKLLREEFQTVWEWLINKTPSILAKNADTSVMADVMHCLITFFSNWAYLKNVNENSSSILWHYIETLYKNLIKVTSHICLLTSNIALKPKCNKLLKFVLMKFLNEEKLSCSVQDEIVDDIDNFPEDVEFWPKSDIDIFFCICHICVSHSRMIWKRQHVVEAIERCFYIKRFAVRTFILKSIYYLYPILIDGINLDYSTKVLGDDLLNYFSKLCSVSYLYSYNSHQLKWILERAPKSVKLTVLTQWLTSAENEESLEKILISTIQTCGAEMTLLQLMMDNCNLGKKIGLKSAILLSKLTNPEISAFITLTLPFTIDKPMSFYNLILAEPGICVNSDNSVLICSLMGAVLPTLNDTQVLRGACIFSSKLLANNKKDARCIQGFCRNVTNIRHLVDITDKVDDETGTEIIGLLKVAVLVQQRNKVKLAFSLRENFKLFIRGSTEKIRKSLRLLHHTMIYKDSMIVLDPKYLLETYHILLDYSLDSVFHETCMQCIITLLKRRPWLAQTISTSIHIEMACLSFSDSTVETNVFKLLDVWFALIRREPYNGFALIPETAIRSFIKRGNIAKSKMDEYLQVLECLLKRQDHKTKKNIFF